MFETLKSSWGWLVDGLTEALTAALDRFNARPSFHVMIGDGAAAIRADSGAELGQLIGEGAMAAFDPPDLTGRLEGAAIDVEIPAAWVLRRALHPVAAESAPFVEAFARHQIEQITPWRSDDAYFKVTTRPLEDDPSRLAVVVDVVARRMVDATLDALAHLRPAKLRLLTQRAGEPAAIAIPIGDRLAPRQQRRRGLALTLLIAAPLLAAAWFVFVSARIGGLNDEIADLDQRIEARKAVLAAASGEDASGADPTHDLRVKRTTRPRVVETLEALSAALPDAAYLIDLALEKDKLRIIGVASKASDLVPSLEQSHRFKDVTFNAATTREDNGATDRFHLEMQVVGAAGRGAP